MKRAITSLCICASLLLASCIDNSFNLADVSGEVTLGGEELVVPLAEITPIRLGDLIEDSEYLNSKGEDGAYQFTYSSFGEDPTKYEKISVEGISIPAITGLSPTLDPIGFSFQSLPTSLSMAGIFQSFDVEFPALKNIMKIEPIKMTEELNFNLPISGQGLIDEMKLAILKSQGYDVIKNNYSSEVVFDAEIELLKQLNKVDYVEFGCDKHPYGAPFEIKVDLNGLQDVVSGGVIKLNIEFPQGYYLRDEDGKDFPNATHNILAREVVLQPKQRKVEFLIYLHRIDYSDHNAVDGKLAIEDHIKYNYELELNIGVGTYNLDNMPKFSIEAAPEYKDVEVVINHFEIEGTNYALNYTFDGMPSMVDIEKVAFKNTNLTFSLKGLEWMQIIDNKSNEILSPIIKVTLPECMHFKQSALFSNNILSADAQTLANGVQLELEYIDCKANGVKQENGQLVINSNITAEVDLHSMDGHTVLISSLTPPVNPLAISVGIADAQLQIDTDNTKVEWSGDQVYDFNLGNNIPTISQSIDVPEMIASIKEIEIGKANNNGEPVSIAFKLASLASFPVNELDVDVSINLGKLLRPTQQSIESGIIRKNDNGDYILTIKEAWQPNSRALEKSVSFEALENVEIKNGKINLNQTFPVTGFVKIKDGQSIDLSELDTAKIDIDVKIDDIEVRTFTGGINLSVAPEEMVVELGDFSNLGVSLNNLTLHPILDIKLKDNPTNIPLSGNIVVKTLDNNGNISRTIDIPTINIAGSGASHLVLSTSRNAAKYEGVEGVSFIAVDELLNLLADGIPSKVAVNMEVKTNKDDIRTINLADAKNGYDIEYQYAVVMPLEFGSETNLSYESTITGLNSTFAELADTTKGLKVGDIGLIAEFGTTIPFNIVLSASLINANGTNEGIDARLDINDCLIKGYDKKDGGEKSVSKVDLNFNFGDSQSLEGLKNADGIRFKFTLYSTGDGSTLKSSQYIDGKLKLRLRDGLTVDVFDFMSGNLE